jgi:Family of unknown function (DUF5343)
MPRRASERPAAYTRTRHLDRFLDEVPPSRMSRVDGQFVEKALGLSGGDVRAFLQSLRVLGLIDALGRPTERLHRARARDGRARAMREGLKDAYPELAARWEAGGGLSREEVEDHFKVTHGLGSTSAEPAAKLFLDFWNRGVSERGTEPAPTDRDEERYARPEASSKGGEVWATPSPHQADARQNGGSGHQEEETGGPRGETIARLLYGLVHIEIGRDWDAARINLVFDRLERLVDRLTSTV